MNFRTTLILIAILAAVGGVLYVERDRAPAPAESSAPALQIAENSPYLDVASSSINRLAITRASDQPIILSREGVHWSLQQPVTAPADDNIVMRLVDELATLHARGRLTGAEAKSAGTGLDSPRIKIEIGTTDGKTVMLNVGERSVAGDNLYVQRDGDPNAAFVAGDIADDLTKPASAFRRMKLFEVSSSQLQQVRLTTADQTVALQRTSAKGESWQITQPQPMPADQREVADLVIALTNLSANQFVAEKVDDPQRRRLDSPAIEVSFSTQPPSTQATTHATTEPSAMHSVKFGAFTDVTKQFVYATDSDSSALMTVPASVLDSFRKKPLDLRDRQVASIEPASISHISITKNLAATTRPTTRPASQQRVVISRASIPTTQATQPATQPATHPVAPNPEWQIEIASILVNSGPSTRPAPSIAGDRMIDSLLSQLHPLRAERYLGEQSSTTQPADQYTVEIQTTAAGGQTASYTIHLNHTDGEPDRADYNGLSFEPGAGLFEALKGDFSNPSVAPGPPMPGPEER